MKNQSNDSLVFCLALTYILPIPQQTRVTWESKTMTNAKQTERDEQIQNLRKWLVRDDRIYTVLRHVSSSGMTRYMDLYYIRENRPCRITWAAAKALGWTYDNKREALKVGGCGMDMGFHAVYTLSSILFRDDGFKDSSTGEDAGYSLLHEWM